MRIHNVNLIEINSEEFLRMKPGERILLYDEACEIYTISFCDNDCPAKLNMPRNLSRYRYFVMTFGELPKA